MPTHLLVLAGGAGTRFWPASRRDRPKQLLPLTGGAPLVVETIRRALPLVAPERVLVATGAHLVEGTAALLPDVPRENLLVEPVPRNTAPCIAWAAARVARSAPDDVVVVLPSDHHITDPDGFLRALATAVRAAEQGFIVTLGIRPTRAETGYGYIETEPGAPAAGDRALAVVRFVEKPDRERAEQFVASGRFLWNAGMFVFRARDLLDAVRAHLPALADGLDAIDAAARSGREADELARTFPLLPAVSIDHGVMEHVAPARLRVVPGDFGWSDVGGWRTAWELAPKDAAGNHAPAGACLVDARGNHVVDLRSDGKPRVVALIGVEDLVVVETDDALLVVPKDRAQDVRAVVDLLKARGVGT